MLRAVGVFVHQVWSLASNTSWGIAVSVAGSLRAARSQRQRVGAVLGGATFGTARSSCGAACDRLGGTGRGRVAVCKEVLACHAAGFTVQALD